MKLALPTSHILIAASTLALAAGPSCGTRTSIGEIVDAGPGDVSIGGGAASGGTAGAHASGGVTGTGGVFVPRGSGGAFPDLGGHTGGMVGAPGGHTGGNVGTGAGGAAGGMGSGGSGGVAACQAYPPQGQGGQGGQGGRLGGCAAIVYPASGFFGDNILADGCTTFTTGVQYELAARNTVGDTVQVTVTPLNSGTGGTTPVVNPGGDWLVKNGDSGQIFQTRPILQNETNIEFFGTGMARVDIYDCDPVTPSRSKVISWTR